MYCYLVLVLVLVLVLKMPVLVSVLELPVLTTRLLILAIKIIDKMSSHVCVYPLTILRTSINDMSLIIPIILFVSSDVKFNFLSLSLYWAPVHRSGAQRPYEKISDARSVINIAYTNIM